MIEQLSSSLMMGKIQYAENAVQYGRKLLQYKNIMYISDKFWA